MRIIKVENNEQLSAKATELFIDILKNNKNPVFGLATGSTAERLYENLMNECETKNISFQNAVTFNLDEYVGVSKDNPASYHYYMENKLFRGIDIKRENAYIPNGMSSNLERECMEYEKLIHEAENIDLQILGIGVNGHIGFNEPGTSFTSRTHVVELFETTRIENSRFFPRVEDVPRKALTMGIGTIMEAKKIVLLAQGEKKAEALHNIVHGKVTEEVPASILQHHPDATIITDLDV